MKRSIARDAAVVFLFPIVVLLLVFAVGCGYDSTAAYPPPPPTSVAGLWTASGGAPAIVHLAPSQLLASAGQTPATVITTPSAALTGLGGVAVDVDGALWVTSSDDSALVAFSNAALLQSGTTPARTVITSIAGSLSKPTGVAFDRQHRMWVANAANGTVVRFDRPQTATGGAQVPAVIISGLGEPASLAFDAAGLLWVSDSRRDKIAGYSEAQLAQSGFIEPQVVISSLAGALAIPAGIAFDADGNLWVANIGNRRVVSYTPQQIAATSTPAPNVIISSNGQSLDIPAGLAFDSDGSLWVIGGTGTLEKFPHTSLAVSGAPAPTVTVTTNGYNLFWSAAFFPKPTGLPLN
ncbi:MAG: NHL repeat-containing protein [Gemmatimonadaceae bacterium]